MTPRDPQTGKFAKHNPPPAKELPRALHVLETVDTSPAWLARVTIGLVLIIVVLVSATWLRIKQQKAALQAQPVEVAAP